MAHTKWTRTPAPLRVLGTSRPSWWPGHLHLLEALGGLARAEQRGACGVCARTVPPTDTQEQPLFGWPAGLCLGRRKQTQAAMGACGSSAGAGAGLAWQAWGTCVPGEV